MPRNTQRPSTDLQRLRLQAGLTRPRLALLARVATNTVRAAEYGTIPSLRVQLALADALSVALGHEVTHLQLWPLIENGVAA